MQELYLNSNLLKCFSPLSRPFVWVVLCKQSKGVKIFLPSKISLLERRKEIKNFHCFQLINFLLLLKHILLKKGHDLLFSQLFVSKHFYEYFFLILMYVFVNLKSFYFDFGFKTFNNFLKFKGFFH